MNNIESGKLPTRVARYLAVTLSLGLAVAWADFDSPTSTDSAQQFAPGNVQRQDTPNDPKYDCAETDREHGKPGCSSLYDQRFDLFGFPAQSTRNTVFYTDPDSPNLGQPQVSGLNVAGAWKLTRGRADVSIAILDTGARWNNAALRTQVRLNCGELPAPQNASGQTTAGNSAGCQDPNLEYDINGDGAFNVDDYLTDARVNNNAGPNGIANLIDAQDLIIAFSNDDDADGNAFVDDIAGWDFFDDDNDANDASSYFAAKNHGNGRAEEAVEQGNDGVGEIGICPKCQYVPIRIWDTFVSDANGFGLGVLYAADNGIDVIEGANGSLYHSAFAEKASDYAWKQGLVQTYSGDDLNTGNHNFPAAYNHVMLIEGVVADNEGLGESSDEFAQGRDFFCTRPEAVCPTSNTPVGTYFRGGNTTQFGGKSSVATWGPTGSQATGRASGVVAMVISAGKEVFPSNPLTPDEVRILVEQTAEDVLPLNTQGSGNAEFTQKGWDSHFGWGRVDVGAAVGAVFDQNIPPEAVINTPDWYAPLVGADISFSGIARNTRGGGDFAYIMEWGPGIMPGDGDWTQFAAGSGTSGEINQLGTLGLAAVRTALENFTPQLDTGDATFAPGVRHPLKDHFTIRLTVTDPDDPTRMAGVDRKVLTAVPDGQNLAAGYPKRLGSGGEAPIRYADINGDNIQELLVPTMDGVIHAYQPDGSELPGWPVETRVMKVAEQHVLSPGFVSGDVPVPLEPPRAPTIADLDNDGKRQVIVPAGFHLYVFNADGSPRDGFPVRTVDANCVPALQSQTLSHPKCGFLASASIAYIRGRYHEITGEPEQPVIVLPGMDGHLYVWNADGTPLSDWGDWPRLMQDVNVDEADRMLAEAINPVSIVDLNGDGKDDIVVPTHEVYGDSGGPEAPGAADDVSFASVELKATRLYAINGATGETMPGWPVAIAGIIQDTLPLIGPSHDPAVAKVNGQIRILASATGTGKPELGDGLSTYAPNGTKDVTMKQDGKGGGSNITDTSGGINLFESAIFGNLTGVPGSPLSVVKYQLSLGQVTNLALVGQNNPYNHMIGAWNAQTGSSEAAYPTITDDYQFLSSSVIARVDSSRPNPQIVAGTGLGLVHAYDGVTAVNAPGFPKVTGGWIFAPAAISDRGRIATITREGYLFEWEVPGMPTCQSEWSSFRHDPQGSGNYDRDGTQPGAILDLAASRVDDEITLTFTATGDDDALCGTAAEYRVLVDGVEYGDTLAAPQSAGSAETLVLNGQGLATRNVVVQAVDEAGNIGYPAEISVAGSVAIEFAFIERHDMPPNRFVTSNTITLTAFDGPLPISVGNGAQYRLNNSPYTNDAGEVTVGDQLTVRHVTSTINGGESVSTVNVGGFIATFRTVTTIQDKVPEPFDFGSQQDVEPGSMVESDVIAITGFDTATIIQPGSGIEYRVNGAGDYSAAVGELNPGESLQVRHTASEKALGYTRTWLKVGGVRGDFTTRSRQ